MFLMMFSDRNKESNTERNKVFNGFTNETNQGNLSDIGQRCRAFVESVSIAMFLLDTDGRIQLANKATETIFGYDSAKLSGKAITLLMTDVQEFLYFNQGGEESKSDQDEIQNNVIETIGVRNDGEIVALEVVRGEFVCDDQTYNTLLVRDISHRKETEAALLENQQRHETLLDAVNGFMWEGEAFPFKLTHITRQVEKILGYSVERCLNEEGFWKTVLHPEDRDRVIEFRREKVKSKSSYELKYRVFASDGSIVWLRDTANVVLKDGNVVKLRGLMVDITEHMQTECDLAASKQLYYDLIENANDIIYTHEIDGWITSINEAGMRFMELTREEILDTNVFDILAPESIDKAREILDRKLAGEEKTIYEAEVILKNNKRATLEVSSKLIYQDGKPVGIHGIARDITERKNLQIQLHQAQKMETVGQLAGGIAHDFNNLLTVIFGKTDLALMQLKDSSGQLREDIEEIRNAAEKAADMTQQILAFSRKQSMQPRIIDLNETISGMSKILKRLIDEDIEMETKLHPDLGCIETDPSQIEQVVMNLAINARDSMPNGGKLIIETNNVVLDEIYARQHLNAREGKYVVLTVSDNGIGMSDEILKRVFEPFFTTKETGKGTGLGLATVYGIVKQSGGFIGVYSEEGIGTTFKVYLPQSERTETILPEQTSGDLFRGDETILLVEDDDSIRAMVREMLEIIGYEVIEAANGLKAIDIVQTTSDPIDLLITDVVMPGISGHQLAEELAAQKEEMAVLYMTGYSEEAIVRHGLLKRGLNFIQKPFTFESLAFKVRELLDRKVSSE